MPAFTVFTVGLIGAAIAAIVWSRRLESARTASLQRAAAELGLAFTPGPFARDALPVPIPDLELFTRGPAYGFRNFLQGTDGAGPVTIFEFSYRGGAKSSTALRIVALQNNVPELPAFSLQMEFHLGPFVNTPAVVDKIDFPALPEFTRRISVSRSEPAAARAFFDDGLAAFFLARWGVAVESREGWLYVSRTNEPVSANEKPDTTVLRGLLDGAREVQAALNRRARG